jgi:hypothetical protein
MLLQEDEVFAPRSCRPRLREGPRRDSVARQDSADPPTLERVCCIFGVSALVDPHLRPFLVLNHTAGDRDQRTRRPIPRSPRSRAAVGLENPASPSGVFLLRGGINAQSRSKKDRESQCMVAHGFQTNRCRESYSSTATCRRRRRSDGRIQGSQRSRDREDRTPQGAPLGKGLPSDGISPSGPEVKEVGGFVIRTKAAEDRRACSASVPTRPAVADGRELPVSVGSRQGSWRQAAGLRRQFAPNSLIWHFRQIRSRPQCLELMPIL